MPAAGNCDSPDATRAERTRAARMLSATGGALATRSAGILGHVDKNRRASDWLMQGCLLEAASGERIGVSDDEWALIGPLLPAERGRAADPRATTGPISKAWSGWREQRLPAGSPLASDRRVRSHAGGARRRDRAGYHRGHDRQHRRPCAPLRRPAEKGDQEQGVERPDQLALARPAGERRCSPQHPPWVRRL